MKLIVFLLMLLVLPIGLRAQDWETMQNGYTTVYKIGDTLMGQIPYDTMGQTSTRYLKSLNDKIYELESVIDSLEDIAHRMRVTIPIIVDDGIDSIYFDCPKVFYLEVVGHKLDSCCYEYWDVEDNVEIRCHYFVSEIYDTVWVTSGVHQIEKPEE